MGIDTEQFRNRMEAHDRIAAPGFISVLETLWKTQGALETVVRHLQTLDQDDAQDDAGAVLTRLQKVAPDIHTVLGTLILVLRDAGLRGAYAVLAMRALGAEQPVGFTAMKLADLHELTKAFSDIAQDKGMSVEARAGYLAACVQVDGLWVSLRVLTKIPSAELVRLIAAYLVQEGLV